MRPQHLLLPRRVAEGPFLIALERGDALVDPAEEERDVVAVDRGTALADLDEERGRAGEAECPGAPGDDADQDPAARLEHQRPGSDSLSQVLSREPLDHHAVADHLDGLQWVVPADPDIERHPSGLAARG